MNTHSVYIVSDYNKKYIETNIVSAISSILHKISSRYEFIYNFNTDVKDEINRLTQDYISKVIIQCDIKSELEIEKVVDKLNGCIQKELSDQAIYSVEVSSSRT